jgi:hypothetical protein
MAGVLPGQMKLMLQIFLGNFQITQRHIGGAMARQWVCDMKVKAWEFLFLRPLPERI